MTAEQLMQDYLTESEMAKVLGIKVGALRNRISQRRDHPPFIGKGKARRFPREEIRKWEKSQIVHQKSR